MSFTSLTRDKAGCWEAYCATCEHRWQLGFDRATALLCMADHKQGHDEAAAVKEAERIIEEGARA